MGNKVPYKRVNKKDTSYINPLDIKNIVEVKGWGISGKFNTPREDIIAKSDGVLPSPREGSIDPSLRKVSSEKRVSVKTYTTKTIHLHTSDGIYSVKSLFSYESRKYALLENGQVFRLIGGDVVDLDKFELYKD